MGCMYVLAWCVGVGVCGAKRRVVDGGRSSVEVVADGGVK